MNEAPSIGQQSTLLGRQERAELAQVAELAAAPKDGMSERIFGTRKIDAKASGTLLQAEEEDLMPIAKERLRLAGAQP